MDLDAYELILELLAHSHGYGESIADTIELWISATFGLVIMAYLAPERMTFGIAALVVSIYVSFSVWSLSNVGADMNLSRAAVEEARILSEHHQIDSASLSYRLDTGGGGSNIYGSIFLLGLFFGSIGYVVYTARKNYTEARNS